MTRSETTRGFSRSLRSKGESKHNEGLRDPPSALQRFSEHQNPHLRAFIIPSQSIPLPTRVRLARANRPALVPREKGRWLISEESP